MKCFLEDRKQFPASSLWLNKAEQWMGKMKLDGGEGPCMPWGSWAQALSWQKTAAPTHACSEPRTAALGMCPRRQLSKVWTRRYKYLLKARVLNLSLGELRTDIHWKPRKWHPFWMPLTLVNHPPSWTHGRRFNTMSFRWIWMKEWCSSKYMAVACPVWSGSAKMPSKKLFQLFWQLTFRSIDTRHNCSADNLLLSPGITSSLATLPPIRFD